MPLIVTISRQLASGGAYIGQMTAKRLGIRYVDREVLRRAAAALGLSDEREIEGLEERTPRVWDTFVRALSFGAPDSQFVPPSAPRPDEREIAAVETQVIRELAARDDAVIVGRGSAHILRGDGVMRIFVHAPVEHRIAVVQQLYQLGEIEAERMVRESDRDRAAFVHDLTGRSWTDACLYHLALDTSIVPVDVAVDLVVNVVNARRQGRVSSAPDA
jgi:cytidylate kinase